MVHDTPEKRGSWQAHGQVSFYVGRALNHYWCLTVWMSVTHALRLSDCLPWHPIKLHRPGSSPVKSLTAALGDMQTANSPFPMQPQLYCNKYAQLHRCFVATSAHHNKLRHSSSACAIAARIYTGRHTYISPVKIHLGRQARYHLANPHNSHTRLIHFRGYLSSPTLCHATQSAALQRGLQGMLPRSLSSL